MKKILICGGNGAGKTTLGKKLAELSGCTYRDAEDYWFPQNTGGYAYAVSRTEEEVASLLLADLEKEEDFVFSSVKIRFGEAVLARFTHVVFVDTPASVRMQRVEDRSYRKFGARMRPGGDLYERERDFFTMVRNRPAHEVEDWLRTLAIPILTVDGTRPPEQNARAILCFLQDAGVEKYGLAE